jgi:ligand-binding sensor domain-containing protein/signal transduction histidine kinase
LKIISLSYQIVLILLASICSVQAQPTASIIRYRHFTINDNLSHNNVTSLIQDQYGYIWIGTFNGLNRFDGYQFTHYKNNPADTNSISSNTITSLLLDSKGYIWVGTNNGLNRYDPKTETFIHYRHSNNDLRSIANNIVNCVYEDKKGDIWVGTDKTFDRLERKTNTFIHYEFPATNIIGQSLITKEIIEYDNDLLISVWGLGVYRFNRQTKIFTLLGIEHLHPRTNNWVQHFYIDKSNHLYAADGNLLRFDKDKNILRVAEGDKNRRMEWAITCVTELPNGTYITGTTGIGYKKYNSQFGVTSTQFLNNNPGIYQTQNNTIECMLTTKSGEVWFGMFTNGLYLYDANQKQFEGNEYQPLDKNSVLAGPVTSLSTSKEGEVLIGYRFSGVSIFNPQKNNFTHLASSKNTLNSAFVKSVFIDNKKNKWIGTWGGGLNRIDGKTGEYTYFRSQIDSETALQDDFITSICQSKDERIWVATVRGISVMETSNEKDYSIKSFIYKPGTNKSPPGLRTDVVVPDKVGDIWVGTDNNGLCRYNEKSDTFTFFKNDYGDSASLGSNKVQAIFEDSKKRIWIGCSGGGLNLYVKEKNNFIRFDELDGLPSDNILSIVEDDKGKLWIGTDKGLSNFDIETRKFANFNENDGLLSNQFLPMAMFKSPIDGKIFAGTYHGLVSFYPDSILKNTFIPPVYISSFKKYLTKESQTSVEIIPAIQQQQYIKLNYHENTFAVGFVCLNYSNSSKNQYAYRMEGLNDNWVQLGNSRELTFSDLSPGKYTFHVKASNSDQLWNEKGASLTIYIMPPWWQTWWAYVLYAMLVSSVVYLFIKQRIQRGVQRIKDLQSLRTKISSDLHDDVGTILSGLAMQSQMLSYSAKEEQKTSLNEISNMSRDAMERMRDTVWAMDSRKDKYENLVDRMRDFAERSLPLKNITHQFDMSTIDTKRFIDPEKRQAIYLVFKEAITNIIKHSNGNNVVIRFSSEKNSTVLTIKDNGSRKPASNSDGSGMINMKMRAEKIGGTLNTKYDDGFMVELVIST